MLTKKFFCPVNGYDCPYFKEEGSCAMVDEGDNPINECDDAGYFYEEDEDPFVWEDENGNRFDVAELLEEGYHFVNGEPVYSLDHAVVKEMEKISFPPDFDEMGSNEFKG